MDENFDDYEIVIIESGSMDGSREICDCLATTFQKINVVHEEKKSGFGSALKLGYALASKDQQSGSCCGGYALPIRNDTSGITLV